nr:hypothetical protein [uncultured Cohaesibacter sp.]
MPDSLPSVTILYHSQIYVVRVVPASSGPAQYFVPFIESRFVKALPVDEHRVFVASEDNQIALYDLRSRQVVTRKIAPEESKRLSSLFGADFSLVKLDADLILINYGKRGGLGIYRLKDLELVRDIAALCRGSDGEWLLTDYGTAVKARKVCSDSVRWITSTSFVQTSEGFLITNDATGKGDDQFPLMHLSEDLSSVKVQLAEALEAESYDPYQATNPLRWLSPSGKYALRPSWDPKHFTAESEEGESGHPDYTGNEALGLCLELWVTDPAIKLSRTFVALVPPDKPNNLVALANPVRLDLKVWAEHTKSGTLPVSCHLDDPTRVRHLFADFQKRISSVLWDTEENGFWVQFGNSQFRHILLQGDIGPLITCSELHEVRTSGCTQLKWYQANTISLGNRYVGFCDHDVNELLQLKKEFHSDVKLKRGNDCYKKEARRCIRETLRPHVRISSMNEADIRVALQSLARMIEHEFSDLLTAGLVKLRFKVGSRVRKEDGFFKQIVKEKMIGLVPELRNVVLTYCSSTPDNVQLDWMRNDEHGAFIPALKALLALDPTAQDVLRLYFCRYDAEHELGAEQLVFEPLLKTQRWKNKDIIRTGISLSIAKNIGGNGDWNYYLHNRGLVSSALKLMDADELRKTAKEELEQHVRWRKLSSTQSEWIWGEVSQEIGER